MLSSVKTPFQQFFALNGDPLEGGKIYIGEPNKDPEQFPVQVYWDAAGTIPAPQPIRTVSGYPARNGTPAQVYYDDAYSMRVRQSNDVLVFYFPSLVAGVSGDLSGDIISFLQVGTGAVERTVQSKERDIFSVKDFGAVGDGVTDDTVAIQKAIDAAINNGAKELYFPTGNYSVNQLNYAPSFYAGEFCLRGDGYNASKLTKRNADGNPVVQFGNATATIFVGGITVKGLNFIGQSTSAGAVVAYDLVRTNFYSCRFASAQKGLLSYGGIVNFFNECLFEGNQDGAYMDEFASLAGGGKPNFITFRGCVFGLNTQRAAYVNHGRRIFFEDCDIESNGTIGSGKGIVECGTQMGNEVYPGGPYTSTGVVLTGCWFENNNGLAQTWLQSGRNAIRDTYYLAAGGTYTNDMRFTGGGFVVDNVVCDTTLAANLFEDPAGTIPNNLVQNSAIPNISYNNTKTVVMDGTSIQMRNGSVPIVALPKPLIQQGVATTSGAGTATVVFPTAYSNIPFVSITPVDATAGYHIAARISAYSATQFTVEISYIPGGGGAPATAAIQFAWQATGPTT